MRGNRTNSMGDFHPYSDDGDAVGRSVTAQHAIGFQVYPIKIGPGQYHITSRKRDLIITVLGSCVAACIRDPVAGVGGLNHFMLPQSGDGMWDGGPPSMRFGNVAMERLITGIEKMGGVRERFEVKLVGGGRVMDFDFDVGERNCVFAERYMADARLHVVSSDLRGSLARRVHYMPVEGRLWVKSLPHELLESEGSEDAIWA